MREPYIIWSNHLTGDRAKEFDTLLKNSTTVLSRLKQIVDEEIESLRNKEETVKDFEDPNWANKQAFRNGQRAGLKYVQNLLSFLG